MEWLWVIDLKIANLLKMAISFLSKGISEGDGLFFRKKKKTF